MAQQKRHISIRVKILSVFILLILFFSTTSILNLIYSTKSQEATERISTVYVSSIVKLGEFRTMVGNSKSLISSWTKNELDQNPDKRALKKLHDVESGKIIEELGQLSENWEDQAESDSLVMINGQFKELLDMQAEVMNNLNSVEAYQNFLSYNDNVDKVQNEIVPLANQIEESLAKLIETQKENTEQAKEEANNIASNQRMWVWISLGLIAAGLIFAILLSYSLSTPIIRLQRIIDRLSSGELPQEDLPITNDETGKMTESVQQMIEGLRKTSDFAVAIGDGKLDADFTPLSEKDVLGNSLLAMRNNLKEIASEDERRNWANEGMAKFGEVLRTNSSKGLREFSEAVVTELVQYLGANQGWLYLVNKDDLESKQGYLELTGCYAYNEKKFLEQRIELGEGLTGQCWQEGEAIYMDDVPQGYTSITSGLGEATPSSILIMPLKMNDEIYGVIELASFKKIEDHEVKFVRRISENIASTVSVTRTNERTAKLLEESTMLTENLKSQEEEMRQNFEELSSTQEEMHRREEELKSRIKELEEKLGFQS